MDWRLHRPVLALLFALACSGCAPLPYALLHPAGTSEALATAAEQVQRCYRPPKGGHVVRSIITRLRVRYNADGSLVGLPVLLWQKGVTADNRAFAGRMAEAASLAVMNCAPIRLPPEYYRSGWDYFDLTFSPTAVA